MTDYLDRFDGLVYEFNDDKTEVQLKNLSSMNGMSVAELLTYLYDDGYVHFGAMDAGNDGGFLLMYK